MDKAMELQPEHYPNTSNSGIADAGRFSFDTVPEGGGLMHTPARFPDGSKVTAKCGTYGYADLDRDGRGVHWSSGYLADDRECVACLSAS